MLLRREKKFFLEDMCRFSLQKMCESEKKNFFSADFLVSQQALQISCGKNQMSSHRHEG